MARPPVCETPALDPIEQALARGDGDAARAALLDVLVSPARAGDPVAAITVQLLSQSRFAPDAMAAAVDRLLGLVREQEAQIRALQALLETRL